MRLATMTTIAAAAATASGGAPAQAQVSEKFFMVPASDPGKSIRGRNELRADIAPFRV